MITAAAGKANCPGVIIEPGRFEKDIQETIARIEAGNIVKRIWDRDHTVWKPGPGEITNRLGWLTLPETMQGEIPGIEAFAGEIRSAFDSAVLLGMGGSSLAPEMFADIFGSDIDFTVLDTTIPAAIRAAAQRLDPQKSLFIVSTKSGGTVETISLFRYFHHLFAGKGSGFAAITDPGSTLAATASQLHFRRTFLNDPDVGGRFSALSFFGLVPAGLCGVDIRLLLERARGAMLACRPETPVRDNPGAILGAAIGEAARQGADKLTFFISPRIFSFGHWLEQLIAESTGKEGRGILPVTGEIPGGKYGNDRFFVFIELEGEEYPEALHAEASRNGPTARIRLPDVYALGEQVFIWEMATAVAGHVLKINPFDQPDVESTKRAARSVVAEIEKGSFALPAPDSFGSGVSVFGAAGKTPADALRGFLAKAGGGNYICIQAYLPMTPGIDASIAEIRGRLRMTGAAVTSGYGPRYLHSTGQLHKGDSGKGLFIQLTAEPEEDLPVPSSRISFGALTMAAALGDRKALLDAGRPVIALHLEDPKKGLDYILQALKDL